MVAIKNRSEILKTLKPTDEECRLLKSKVNEKIALVEDALNGKGHDVVLRLGGSFAKDTYLKGNHDVDVFVIFRNKLTDEEMSGALYRALETQGWSVTPQKGSRDYYAVTFGTDSLSLCLEFVPVVAIASPVEAENSTDISVFHIDYVQDHIKEQPGLADEIRLTKQLLKAQGLYGAESYLNGFSGHVVDILVIRYGSLSSLLASARGWELPCLVDVTDEYTSLEEARNVMGDDKFSSLVVVDPVLPNRNAAKALGQEQLLRFLLFCSEREEIGKDDFRIPSPGLEELKHRFALMAEDYGFCVFSLEVFFGEDVTASEDIMGSKLMKSYQRLARELTTIGFNLVRYETYFSFSEQWSLCCFIFEHRQLPEFVPITGPPLHMITPVKEFTRKHPEWWLLNGRVMGLRKRKYNSLDGFLQDLDLRRLESFAGRRLDFVSRIQFSLS